MRKHLGCNIGAAKWHKNREFRFASTLIQSSVEQSKQTVGKVPTSILSPSISCTTLKGWGTVTSTASPSVWRLDMATATVKFPGSWYTHVARLPPSGLQETGKLLKHKFHFLLFCLVLLKCFFDKNIFNFRTSEARLACAVMNETVPFFCCRRSSEH